MPAQRGEGATPPPRLTGELRLRVGVRGSRSTAVGQFTSGSLRVLRAHYPDASGQPSFTIVNPGGGYLGGDAYATRVDVLPAASVLLTTQSATKVYRTPQGPARAIQHFELAPGARLESVPDALIAYREARYQQDTFVEMAPDASLALGEIVTQGWSPDGTPFRFEEVSLLTRVRVGGRLAVADNLLIRPAEGGAGHLMLAGRSHVASLLVVDPRADDGAVAAVRGLLAERFPTSGPPTGAPLVDAPLVGVTRLAVPGFAIRALTGSTRSAETVIHTVLDWMRAAWHGQAPLNLRKL
ncbi:urease accessory protein UreD [Sinomonas sp.]|uniref:urease accessory protein UreD n=1 Tax=Sinomonas sp. TaxID=1914986 RepID=UPI002FDF5101